VSHALWWKGWNLPLQESLMLLAFSLLLPVDVWHLNAKQGVWNLAIWKEVNQCF